jgi:hypothetical protein
MQHVGRDFVRDSDTSVKHADILGEIMNKNVGMPDSCLHRGMPISLEKPAASR